MNNFNLANSLMSVVQKTLGILGFRLVRSLNSIPLEMGNEFSKIYQKSYKYTMTSVERMYGLYLAVKYLDRKKIEGDFVECGVWRGGSSMVMALTSILDNRLPNRKIYLYDTFKGMVKPGPEDKKLEGKSNLLDKWNKNKQRSHNLWTYSPINEVKKNMISTGYPDKSTFYVKGRVEDTIPKVVPSKIALLRLDTDWYESTAHELKYLYPKLVNGGVLIVDDYGQFAGAKKAIDEYFETKSRNILLVRLDYTGRMGIKVK